MWKYENMEIWKCGNGRIDEWANGAFHELVNLPICQFVNSHISTFPHCYWFSALTGSLNDAIIAGTNDARNPNTKTSPTTQKMSETISRCGIAASP